MLDVKSYPNFTAAFLDLVERIYRSPEYNTAPRGQNVRESLGVQFRIEDPRDRLLYVPARNFPLTYVVAESLWYLLGENKTEWIANYSGFWNNISDDGKTANSAYGARIFREHPAVADGRFKQWDYVKEELKRDPDSRRAVILIRTPQDSIDAKLDVPCTLSLQFFIRRGRLDMLVTMRSSDLILGITNDVPAFCLFQELMALELGVPIGTYIHTSNSLHIYERHYKMCDEILADKFQTGPALPAIAVTPPLANLNRIQELARSVVSTNGLSHLATDVFDSLVPVESGDYWRDWAKILLAHRAGKLGDSKMKQDLIDSTSFAGYHRFKN